MRIETIDMVEVYDAETAQERICVIAKDEKGGLLFVEVSGTPHEICIACGTDYTTRDAMDLKADLTEYLTSNPHKCRVRDCPCLEEQRARGKWVPEKEEDGRNAFAVSFEPCIKQRRAQLKTPITSASLEYKKGFHIFEEFDRPFIHLNLSHAFFAREVMMWAKARPTKFGNVSAADAGVYDVLDKPVDSFIVRRNLSSFDWISIPARAVIAARCEGTNRFRIKYEDLEPCPDPEVLPPPLVELYYDIETISRQYNDTETENAEYPVGIICTYLCNKLGEKNPKRAIPRRFLLASPNVPISEDAKGIDVYKSEVDLLLAFITYIRTSDPDFIIGFNSNGYDAPYLYRRCIRLGIGAEFETISRMPEYKFSFHQTINTTKATGAFTQTFIVCPGRVFLDLLPDLRKTIKLEGYKLKDVAKNFKLGGKGDVSYTQLYPYFHGTAETRMKAVEYCDRDTFLCVQIARAVAAVEGLKATCRIRRIRAKDSMERGLGYQLMMMIRQELIVSGYRNKHVDKPRRDASGRVTNGALDPAHAEIEFYDELWDQKLAGEKYSGATVIDPEIGLILDILATLDFSSLYPSIMRTFNTCRSTQLPNVRTHANHEHPPNISPAQFAFCNVNVREGVLPRIVKNLVLERKRVNLLMEAETDPVKKRMLDMRQKALKVAANSIYGLAGTTTSDISDLAVALSVTSWGSKYICELRDKIPAAFPGRVKCAYGDTDSVFLQLIGITDRDEGRKLAWEVHHWIHKVSGILHGELKMALEDLSYRTLLIAKKKYVKYVFPAAYPKPGEKEPEPKLKVAGLLNRALAPYVAETVEKVIHEAIVNRASQDDLVNLVKRRTQDLYVGNIRDVSELRHSAQLSKPLADYDDDTPHTMAAKQMLHDGLRVEAGDRIPYYFASVIVPNKETKRDYVIAAHLVDEYDLNYPMYVEEMQKALIKSTQLLFDKKLEYTMHSDFFGGRTMMPRPRPTSAVVDNAIAKALGATKREAGMAKAKKRSFVDNAAGMKDDDDDSDDDSGGVTKAHVVTSAEAFAQHLVPARKRICLGGSAPDRAPPAVKKATKKQRDKLVPKTNASILAFGRVTERTIAPPSAMASRVKPGIKTSASTKAWIQRSSDDIGRKKQAMGGGEGRMPSPPPRLQETPPPLPQESTEDELMLRAMCEHEEAEHKRMLRARREDGEEEEFDYNKELKKEMGGEYWYGK